MPASQSLLFPDPRPLVERLGREFFQQLPEHAGVYLMRDAADVVLYVGKARNLRKRLTSYRVANPDRMARRHLRLLRAVARIELESCADEVTALNREAELLLALKPKFNRAGTWPATPRFLVWRRTGEALELSVTENPEPGWQQFGPMGSAARYLHAVIVRLLWRAIQGNVSANEMPAGWNHDLFPRITRIHSGGLTERAMMALEQLTTGGADVFFEWVKSRQAKVLHPFEQALLTTDIESLTRMLPERLRGSNSA